MTEKALFTGTFDPYHKAHVWQLERAHAVLSFDEVIVAVIRENPKKPDAAHYRHRKELAHLTLASQDLPFDWQVELIDDIHPDTLKRFCESHIPEQSKPLRIVGADSLIEFATDPELRPSLNDFRYTVCMRPQENEANVRQTIALIQSTNPAFEAILSPLPASVQAHDISARNLRGDIDAAHSSGLIVPESLAYIAENKLYSYGSSN